MKKTDQKFVRALTHILHQHKLLSAGDEDVLLKSYDDSELENFEEFLVDEEIVTSQDLLKALQEYYKVPAIDVAGLFFDYDVLHMFPKDVMLRYTFIPYTHDGEFLNVITGNPEHADLEEVIGKYVSYEISFMVGLAHDIESSIKEFYDESITPGQDDDQGLLQGDEPEHDRYKYEHEYYGEDES